MFVSECKVLGPIPSTTKEGVVHLGKSHIVAIYRIILMRTGWKVRNLLGSKYRSQGYISTVSYSIIIASNSECLTKSTEEKKIKVLVTQI